MPKHLLPALLLALACAWAGAVEVNQATEAELDGVRGIGPALSGRILQERQRRPFADWTDLAGRVSGIGRTTAARLSREGLTVNGEPFRADAPARAQEAGAGLKAD